MFLISFGLLFILYGRLSFCSVNIDDNGDPGYECFAEYDTEISSLSSDDLDRVSELKFVFVMYRHGIRFGGIPLYDIFPNQTFPFECNVQTLVSAGLRINSDDNNIDEANNQFNFVYTDDEQFYRDSNCEFTQTADLTRKQMIDQGTLYRL